MAAGEQRPRAGDFPLDDFLPSPETISGNLVQRRKCTNYL
jgi:hypothetical protein